MQELRNCLAILVALEARAPELVDPDRHIAEAARAVVKAQAAAIEAIHARLAAVEAAIVEAAPEKPELLKTVVTPGLQHLENEHVEVLASGEAEVVKAEPLKITVTPGAQQLDVGPDAPGS